MSFSVAIEAGNGAEKLMNLHPDGTLTGGGAVFAFLSGLMTYCAQIDTAAHIYHWYAVLDHQRSELLCTRCRALLDCIWGDGGDSTDYREEDYAFYLHRTHGSIQITEEQFRLMLQRSEESWQPIDDVIDGVRTLLDAFQHQTITPLEGFFDAEFTPHDFEALLANLEWLEKRGHDTVRLNFS